MSADTSNRRPVVNPLLTATMIALTLGLIPLPESLHAQEVSAGQNWMQFRGPDFNPVSENRGLPDRWSPTENLEWSLEIDGLGWSSPIVVGDKVFVTTAIADGKTKPPQAGTNYSNEYVAELSKQGLSEEEIMKKVMERDFELPDQVTLKYALLCIDLNSGKELWREIFFTGNPPGGRHRKNSFASETPTSDGNRVFVYIANLGLYAYDLDGKQLWHQKLENQPIYMEFGTGTSPVLCDGKVLILHDNEASSFLAAFDAKTGKHVWRTERSISEKAPAGTPKSGWGTPYVWKNKLRTEIVTMQPGAAISYDTDGNELWRLAGCTAAPAASSFAIGDMLYINGGRGRPYFAMKPGASGVIRLPQAGQPGAAPGGSGGETGQQASDATDEQDDANRELIVWNRPRTGTYIPTPVIYQDGLYILQDNGILQRLESATGNQSFKQRIKKQGADFTTSPWAYNGKVFCLSEQGDTYVFDAGQEFKPLHVNSLGEFSMSSPAIVGDRLLIRTEKKLYSFRKSG